MPIIRAPPTKKTTTLTVAVKCRPLTAKERGHDIVRVHNNQVWWTPIRLQAMMKSQGIRGPPYRFPHGNTKEISKMKSQSMGKPMEMSHSIFPRIQPHVYSWTKTYGMNFLNWHGSQAQLFLTEPELIKEVLMNRKGFYPKMDMEGYAKKLLGEALITNEGEKWAKIRKLANHTFHAESLKSMVPEMSSSVEMLLERWKDHVGEEIDVYKEFGLLTTEVISRTAFGSSYVEGGHIFEMVAKLTEITVRNTYRVRFPGIRKREKVSNNGEFEDFGSDYLGQLVKISHETDTKKRITIEQMIDEIKTVYGAGHLTTTSLLSWCILLLAIHTD
ncbi:Cytochrome [Abeliophyllum distichum]|uniref:Cytochrome n=1 Tax=Abeliophyllum distichum TaxID=126358 RepID=A0ABD1Q6N8_9LAMI